MTIKLYDTDSRMNTFSAEVISCTPINGVYAVVLDRTAFFPEGGGQPSDTGTLGNAAVLKVNIINGNIIHYTDIPLSADMRVTGTIEWDKRYRRMQNHSGEHIVSGIIFRLFGLDNVGFHIGSEDVTIDTNGPLTRQNITKIEQLANEAIYKNIEIRAEYPTPCELSKIKYRSKLDLTDNIRIVTIEGYDVCACCAPHVSRTGEIGIIKLLDFASYKGGVRIHMKCGSDALDDYNIKYKNLSEIALMLSAKQHESAIEVSRILTEISEYKKAIAALEEQILICKTDSLTYSEDNLILFDNSLDGNKLRTFASYAVKKCGNICAVFSGNDADGYSYAAACEKTPITEIVKAINKALNGHGGGSNGLAQGNVKCTMEEIKQYFH